LAGNLVGDLLQGYLFVGPAYLIIAVIVFIVVHCSSGFLVGIHGKATVAVLHFPIPMRLRGGHS
jgi:hypothetical protein